MNYLVEYFHDQISCYHNTGPYDTMLHIHNHFEIYLFIEGETQFFIDGKFINLQKGNLLFIDNNQIHGPKPPSEKGFDRILIHFSPNLARKLSTEKTSLLKPYEDKISITTLNGSDFEKMKSLMLQLNDEYLSPSTFGHDLEIYSLMTRILLLGARCSFSHPQKISPHHFPELISDLLLFIQENVSNPDLSIDLIAQEFAHSGIYLNRLFKQELGCSIYQYILLSRISAAKKYLEAGENVQSSCLLSGFNDYSNFIRTFKKITGMTPKQYAKLFRIS